MTRTIKATYVNGVLKPKEPLALVDGTEVELILTTPAANGDPLAPVIGIGSSGRKDPFEAVIGTCEGPTDGAASHDKYLYGDQH